MTFDKQPWFMGGDVQHSEQVLRAMSYVALRGEEGVIGADDLKVAALGSPAMGVNVPIGAFAIRDRDTDGAMQTFTGRHTAADQPSIAASGPTTRYDMLILRVEDPYYPGSPWTDPDPDDDDPEARQAHDFVHLRIVSNVPGSARTIADTGFTYSAIPLALITIPGSATTIQNSNILDLRQVLGTGAAGDVGSPIGSIVAYAGDTPPSGWLICDGAYVEQAAYPTLTTVLGTRYGAAVGTTRKLPDMRRRFLAGAGTAFPTGSSDGKANDADRVLAHAHGIPGHSHSHDIATAAFTHEQTENSPTSGGTRKLKDPAAHSHGITGGIAAVGDTVTPVAQGDFIAVNWIIRAV